VTVAALPSVPAALCATPPCVRRALAVNDLSPFHVRRRRLLLILRQICGERRKGWAATALPELRRSGWLSPEDHGDPYNTMQQSITIFLNRS
jgi:hypothetical protein